MSTTRHDGRGADTLRPTKMELGFQRFPEGSVVYRSGDTTVLVAASVKEGVPPWMGGKGKGWTTAEYSMLPRATPQRRNRDGRRGPLDGRSTEIQRLIGRSLRAAVRMDKLGERTINIDCDVLDADGGTRTAAITGGVVALMIALDGLRKKGLVDPGVLREPIAAVSVGYLDGRPLLDLNYVEDAAADVDLNVVATASGRIVEVQGTAEGEPIPREHFDQMLDLALAGIADLIEAQKKVLAGAGVDWKRLLA
ncbi:MAG: ribonuclease PH [Deltaproteobacteria bacterium]|nr:ribonuclease PH [Deltaproteobacteria bacterium]